MTRSAHYADEDAKLAAWLAEAVALAQALKEQEGIAWARIRMGVVAAEYEQAEALHEESVALARAAQNDWLTAMAWVRAIGYALADDAM